MRRLAVYLAVLVCLAPAAALAQGVGINSNGSPPDTSALLDLTSTTKGFLPPRMTSAQRAGIPLPATGLVVYQTDGATGLWMNGGTPVAPNWRQLVDNAAPGTAWQTSGTSLYYSNGKVGVGLSNPSHRLTVSDDLAGLRVVTGTAGSSLASFGGVGTFNVDAPFIPGGRLAILENGNTGIGVTSPGARLDVFGGNGDVIGTEGDLRVGANGFRLKFGITTSGGSSGAATIMEQGTGGAYNVLALGAQGTKVLYVNGTSGFAGIGTDTPNAPLGFPAVFGKKITLYPGATGDAGLAVLNNRLLIYADNPSADVAMGYDQAGTFNERFAVKPSGALAVSGLTGSSGQVLKSNGSANPATWVSPTAAQNANITIIDSGNSIGITDHSAANLPDMGKTLTLATSAKVILSANVVIKDPGCFNCGTSFNQVSVQVDGVDVRAYIKDTANGARDLVSFTDGINVASGTHTIMLRGFTISGSKTIQFGDAGILGNSMTVQVVPQ